MDYTIYIILAVLVVAYFLTKGLNKKNSRNRRSRQFMEGHRKDESKKPRRMGNPKNNG